MTRSNLQKIHDLDDSVLASAAKLRARALALLHGALRESGLDRVGLASLLGVRKSAISALLRGNGNIRIDSLAEYMAVMGFEVDMIATKIGELEAARKERRAPRHEVLTLADHDRGNNPNGDSDVIALTPSSGRSAIAEAWAAPRGEGAAHVFVSVQSPHRLPSHPSRDSYVRKIEGVRA